MYSGSLFLFTRLFLYSIIYLLMFFQMFSVLYGKIVSVL